MSTLVEFMILSGANNRPPMLEKHLIKKYEEFSATEKIQANYDLKATSIILQGLPIDVYSFVNHHRVAKDLWKRVQLLMQCTSLTKQERECKLYDAFDNKFVTDVKLVRDLHTTKFDQLHAYLEQHELHANEIDSGLAVPVFKQGEIGPIGLQTIKNDVIFVLLSGETKSFAAGTSGTRANISGIGRNNSGQQRVVKCFNCQGEGHMARQCPKPKRKRDANGFRQKVLLVGSKGSGPGLQVMTHATSSSGLVPNIIPQQPCNPPKRDDRDTLFQPLFDEYFNPPTIAVSTVLVAVTPRVVKIADSPMSTSIDQDAPSSSIPSTQDKENSLIISQGIEESPKTPLFHDDPLYEFLHEDSTSQGSSSNVRPSHTLFEIIGRWTKEHPIANMINDPSRSVSTRKQLKTDAMWCYFDSFLTSVELKNFKLTMTEPSWINAMQEEIHEFERLQVLELVSCPDKVMLIKLKWIYKVKTDEFGRVLKNKDRLAAQGFR
ncbi:retrovirus-related pol polyprotein from transposon TNT 1-94 [Tanacetum coccineum]|uniref:Retrovirus-related pol polyprotein from transposon TNT 1-94 n=1 Tax=Tanacetum coccineum TaxID=301880 RepID=A0ABQ5FLX9_9ASTR